MDSSAPASETGCRTYAFPLLLALIGAGLVGNYFKYPIFLNIDFLFGSIFAMLALQLFGLGRGIAAAAIISLYTYFLWNHPYAIIILTAEVAFVGWLNGRRKMGLVLADSLYWLMLGMPLVYLFYHLVMHAPHSSVYITMTKQAVNGIANALVARMIFSGYALRSRTLLISYREIVYNLLAFFVLCPTLILLGVGSRTDFAETDLRIRTSLMQNKVRLAHILETWVSNRKTAIINLAEMAASHTAQQMQPHLEQARKSDDNFLRIGLLDREATITAYFPLVDELGHSNIGKNFADRPFIPRLKQTLKPMLSEVVMGRIGTPKPMVSMLAPVVIDGSYGGYVTGIITLEQIWEHLEKSTAENGLLYTLLDKNGQVIMSNRAGQKVMAPFDRGRGTLTVLDTTISQWVPVAPANTPISERWKKSSYIAETSIGSLAEWKLVLEQPVGPFQKILYNNYAGKFTLLFLILLVSLALAELLSSKIIETLENLRQITRDLPSRLAAKGKTISWPESGIYEAKQLIGNFRQMAEFLEGQFSEIRQINESLEQKVEERTSELKEQKQRLADIITGTNVGTWEWNVQTGETVFNERWAEIVGYRLAELEPISIQTWMELVHPDDLKMSGELLEKHFKGELESYEYECRMRHKDGHWVWVLDRGKVASRTESGLPLIMSGTHQDISARKQQEEDLKIAKDQAESANRAKSEFLANMSHEIRTPMNGIIGMTQLLEMSDLSAEQREFVSALKLSGNNLLALINDILDLSKIEAGKINLDLARFSLQECINDIVLTQKSLIQEKGLALELKLAAGIPSVLIGDQLRVRQILLNLLGNAIKFTSRGGIRISAHVLEQLDSSVLVQIEIRDSGIGVSTDALDKIFLPFVQADGSTTRQYGGTGLGLTISRRLAELMGGTLHLESALGAGSCFTVTIPFTVSREPDRVTDDTTAASHVWDGSPLRILFVEDNRINIKFGTVVLKKLGHDVTVAENGRECLEKLEHDHFDLVLLDIQMPVMNGEDALREIRRKEQGGEHRQPVIALTAYALRGEKEHFLEAGFDGYVSKPLDIRELVSEIKRVVPEARETGAAAVEGNHG